MNTSTSTSTANPVTTDSTPAVAGHDVSCDPGCPFCLGPETD